MNIFEYIDKKRNEYETLRDESQLQLKTNENRIQKISSQIERMTEEGQNPSKFFLPETDGNYQREIEELHEKINALELKNDVLTEQIRLCKKEISVLDELELPDFSAIPTSQIWQPMVLSEEQLQKKNVSRETSRENSEEPFENAEKIKLNAIKERIQFCRQISQLDPRRCSLLLEEIINEI